MAGLGPYGGTGNIRSGVTAFRWVPRNTGLHHFVVRDSGGGVLAEHPAAARGISGIPAQLATPRMSGMKF